MQFHEGIIGIFLVSSKW